MEGRGGRGVDVRGWASGFVCLLMRLEGGRAYLPVNGMVASGLLWLLVLSGACGVAFVDGCGM